MREVYSFGFDYSFSVKVYCQCTVRGRSGSYRFSLCGKGRGRDFLSYGRTVEVGRYFLDEKRCLSTGGDTDVTKFEIRPLSYLFEKRVVEFL